MLSTIQFGHQQTVSRVQDRKMGPEALAKAIAAVQADAGSPEKTDDAQQRLAFLLRKVKRNAFAVDMTYVSRILDAVSKLDASQCSQRLKWAIDGVETKVSKKKFHTSPEGTAMRDPVIFGDYGISWGSAIYDDAELLKNEYMTTFRSYSNPFFTVKDIVLP